MDETPKGTSLREQAPHGRICTKFGIEAVVVDVITLAKFFGDRLIKGRQFCGRGVSIGC